MPDAPARPAPLVLADLWLGVPHEYVELSWATHGCDYAFSGPCGQVSTYAVERFLARVTR